MRVVEPGEARGSLKWIRKAVNEHAATLNHEICSACGLGEFTDISWFSPLRADDYAEYRDEQFLELLGVTLTNRTLSGFWPRLGPQWDALGRAAGGEVFLVEAKANIPEILSQGTAASWASWRMIEQSLMETKAFLRVDPTTDWTGPLYQYANRLAHLYLLREINDVPAYLIYVYFIGDDDVRGPGSVAEWQAALTVVKKLLGLNDRNPLSKYIGEVFVDVRTMEDGA
ncbi:MAG: hypothetical protein ACUBOA_05890 [Candidatus Loosdrechtia sp.]|uniref:hypothetical protein n=1 Tax=Candidatus Loosdrechtia sp. TaxID=3101272 RepID=UPI003A79A003|nr:MAG: hypothetical protein QY305_10620 [Candidatus Jettenia sp. AMX2]